MYFTVLLGLVLSSHILNAANTTPPQHVIGNDINIGVLIPDKEIDASRRVSNVRVSRQGTNEDFSSQFVAVEPCNLVTISGSKTPLLNGVYSKVNTTDITFQMYRRVGTRSSLIVGLVDAWCLTMSFIQYELNGAKLSDIQSNCVNKECCVLISPRYNGQLLTESSRVWTYNRPEDKGNADEHLRVACSDFLSPKMGKKIQEINSEVQVQTTVAPPSSSSPSSSTRILVVQQDRKQEFSKQILVDNCDMVTCTGGSECLTKVGCNGCNPICNPYKNRQLTGVIDIKCDMVKCANGYTCQQNGDQVFCVA